MSVYAEYHDKTHTRVSDLRKKFNNVTGTMDKARNAIQHADQLMQKVQILANIAEALNFEDLDPEAFVKNIELYVDDYLKKLDHHVMLMERYGRL